MLKSLHIMEPPISDSSLRSKSLRYSIWDGIFYFLMVGCGESFFIPFGLFLGANIFQIGLLSSFPLLLGALAQILSQRIAKLFKSRKKFVVTGASLQACILPVVVILLFNQQLDTALFIGLICFYQVCGLVIVPSWTSWMGDLVPEDSRGRYFGFRNRITGLFSIVSMVLAGYLLSDWDANPEKKIWGFSILFFSAFIFRLISCWFLQLKWEPNAGDQAGQYFKGWAILTQREFKNFRVMASFISGKSFLVYLASPFFIPYMFDVLKMSYMEFTLTQIAIMAAKYSSMTFWGRLCDKYGNKKVLILGSSGLPLVPLLWITTNNFYVILVIQVFSGIIWSAIELSSFNVTMDNTPPKSRVSGVGMLNALNGTAIFFGALIGSFLIELGSIFMDGYIFIFAISGVLRIIPLFYFIRNYKEVREVTQLSYLGLMLRPFASLNLRILAYPFLPLFKKDNM